jgi:Family of unknown function (DUF6690)
MAGRPLMLATLLGASIGVPYVVSRSSQGPTTPPLPANPPVAAYSSLPASGSATMPPPLYEPPSSFGALSPASLSASVPLTYPSTATPAPWSPPSARQPADAVRFHRIQEVFRFDVSKEWVYQNWDRKSTGLSDPQLFGIRVALVTGTQRSDLAGSLTYLFDDKGQAQRISFRGRTADTTQLVQFLTQTYRLERMEAPAGEQLYQVRSGRVVYSELRTRPESVLLETAPQGSFAVVLELGRPGANRPLQPDVPPLDIPPAAEPTPTAADATTESAKGAEGDAEAKPALVGKFRPATQTEHNQVFEHRWPN